MEARREGKVHTRFNQVVKWFGRGNKADTEAADGCLIFDEAHKAKNLVAQNTKTGRLVLQLQQALKQSRIVYASATGASGVNDMGYMDRIGCESTIPTRGFSHTVRHDSFDVKWKPHCNVSVWACSMGCRLPVSGFSVIFCKSIDF